MTNSITYLNTATNIPIDPLTHKEMERGYAYETSNKFVHIYGKNNNFYVISVGLTVIENKYGNLHDWVIKNFGATEIQPMVHPVGHVVDCVWRPHLFRFRDTQHAFSLNEEERKNAEQALRLLIERLDEIFLFIEPDTKAFSTYSHKTRELLILACTEVENMWKWYLTRSNIRPLNSKYYNTQDYVKLLNPLHLQDYDFQLRAYNHLPSFKPFSNWGAASPTKSLRWYDA